MAPPPTRTPRPVDLATVAHSLRGRGPWHGPAYSGPGGLYAVLGAPPGLPPAYIVHRIQPGARTTDPSGGTHRTLTAALDRARDLASAHTLNRNHSD